MRYVKLVFISKNNNNKFYEMQELNNEMFEVTFGRIEASAQKVQYPISKWNTTYRSKIKKSYVDITNLIVTAEVEKEYKSESHAAVDEFIKTMRKYTTQHANTVYQKAENVTIAQIRKVKELLNQLNFLTNEEEINNKLIELYTCIPRKMKNVKDYLLPNVVMNDIIQVEYDNLSVISTYVSQTDSSNSYLENLKLEITPCDVDDNIAYLINQLKSMRISVRQLFKVKNDNFEDPRTRFLLHGLSAFLLSLS